jgi:hypothetical protein
MAAPASSQVVGSAGILGGLLLATPFAYEPAVEFDHRLNPETNQYAHTPRVSLRGFDDGIELQPTDATILVWEPPAGMRVDRVLDSPIVDMTRQLRSFLAVMAANLHPSDELNGRPWNLDTDVVRMARIKGLHDNAIIIKLSRPVNRFKYNTTIGLFNLPAYLVWNTQEWVRYLNPYGAVSPNSLVPCMLTYMSAAGCAKRECTYNHYRDRLSQLVHLRIATYDAMKASTRLRNPRSLRELAEEVVDEHVKNSHRRDVGNSSVGGAPPLPVAVPYSNAVRFLEAWLRNGASAAEVQAIDAAYAIRLSNDQMETFLRDLLDERSARFGGR